jgi:hypothetical protein
MAMRGLVAAAIVGLLLAGCGYVVGEANRTKLNSVQVGMSRDELLAIMGAPSKREAYGRTEFLMYRTPLTNPVGINEQDFFTPVAIVDGRVVGWGRNYYDNAMKADVTVRQR